MCARGSTFVFCFHCGLTGWKLRKCQYLITVWNTWINYSCAAFEPRALCVYFTYACYITYAQSFQRKCIENKWYGECCSYDKLTVERNIQRATGKRITLLFRLGLQLASPSSFHWSPPPLPTPLPLSKERRDKPLMRAPLISRRRLCFSSFLSPIILPLLPAGELSRVLRPRSLIATTSPGSFIHTPDASRRRLGPREDIVATQSLASTK